MRTSLLLQAIGRGRQATRSCSAATLARQLARQPPRSRRGSACRGRPSARAAPMAGASGSPTPL